MTTRGSNDDLPTPSEVLIQREFTDAKLTRADEVHSVMTKEGQLLCYVGRNPYLNDEWLILDKKTGLLTGHSACEMYDGNGDAKKTRRIAYAKWRRSTRR